MVESSNQVKAIGGYFELELRKGIHYHRDAIRLNTARNCFEYVLLARKYSKVYIPYYTCEVMLQPLHKLGVSYEFYNINSELEPLEIRRLLPNEAFLYTNYFGLKQKCVEKLATIYGTQLIVDNAQAFFSLRLDGIDTFYSARKFFGVPDGAYLYTDCILDNDFGQDKSYGRMQHLLQRIDEGAEVSYSIFRKNDDSLDCISIKKISELTSRILESVDYESIKERRVANFLSLNKCLKSYNIFDIQLQDDIPMIYPFYTPDNTLKKRLIENKIFVATYWPNVLNWCKEGMLEYELASKVIAIPIDQRYDEEDMAYIIRQIKNEK